MTLTRPSPRAIASQYSSQSLTPQCLGSYADIQQLVMLLLQEPQLMSSADAATLGGFCQQSTYSTCLNQLNSQVHAFLQHTASPTTSACDVALGPNVPSLLQLLSNFLCLQDARGDSCPQVVALALNDVGLLKMATGREPFDAKLVFQPTTCALLNATTCCGSAFLEVLFAVSQMTCHGEQADAAQLLAAQCVGLPAPCGAFSVPSYESVDDCSGTSFPTNCSTPAGSCPDSPCELVCAMITNEPPSEAAALSAAAQIAAVSNATRGLSPIGAATYLSTCLEIGSGEPLPPRCATTLSDLQTLLPLSLSPPSDSLFGPGDEAILSQLCSAPSGADMSCMQLVLQDALSWLSAMPQPTTSSCDAVLGPNMQVVSIYAVYFACLPNGDGDMCLPAVGGALEAAGLGMAMRGEVPLDWSVVDPSIFCPALGSTGCCAGALVEVLEGYLTMACQQTQLAEFQQLLSQCDGMPSTCSGFQLPPYTAPTDCSVQVAAGPPADCGFTAGECPQTPCELLCAAATLTSPL